MGNVTLPTPVALAGAAICLLGGYLVGVVAGPDVPSRTTGEVETYDARTGELCLSGDEVADHPAAAESGLLCGLWRRTEGDGSAPQPGEEFRFVTMVVDPSGAPGSAEERVTTVIYGNVVR